MSEDGWDATLTLCEVHNHEDDGEAGDPFEFLFAGGGCAAGDPAEGAARLALKSAHVLGRPLKASIELRAGSGRLARPAAAKCFPHETPIVRGASAHLARDACDPFEYARWPPTATGSRLGPGGWSLDGSSTVGRIFDHGAARCPVRVHLCNGATEQRAKEIGDDVCVHEATRVAVAGLRRPGHDLFRHSECLHTIEDVVLSVTTLLNFHMRDALSGTFIVHTRFADDALHPASPAARFIERRVSLGTMFLHGFSDGALASLRRCGDAHAMCMEVGGFTPPAR